MGITASKNETGIINTKQRSSSKSLPRMKAGPVQIITQTEVLDSSQSLHDRQVSSQSLFPNLPSEVSLYILSYLDGKSLGALGGTCLYFYQLIEKNPQLWFRLLENWLQNKASLVIQSKKKSADDEENLEAKLPNYQKPKLPNFEIHSWEDAKIVLVNASLKYCWLFPSDLLQVIESSWDPQQQRYGCTVSSRIFTSPLNWSSLISKSRRRIDLSEILQEKIRLEASPYPTEKENMEMRWWSNDAFSWREIFFSSFSEIDDPKTFYNECIKSNQGKSPALEDVMNWLSMLLESKKVLLWKESSFVPIASVGKRFIALGEHRAVLFQWEICSNFCGGPYAGFSCGMG